MAYDVQLVIAPERHLAVAEFDATEAEMPQKIGAAFGAVAEYLGRNGMEMSGPAVARFTITDEGFDVSAGFEVASEIEGDGYVVPLDLPAGEVATVTHLGSYETLEAAYDALRAAVEGLGRELDDAAPMWEEYRSPPETPPEETKTVVFWPLKPEHTAAA
jgi:effector-binding domain-containing protein